MDAFRKAPIESDQDSVKEPGTAFRRAKLRRDAAGAYSVAMSQNRPPAQPRWVNAALLAVLAAAPSCDGPAEPGTPNGAPSIAVTVAPSRADVPFGYVATVQVAGDSLQPSVGLLVGGRQIAIPISGPGTYTYEDTLRTLTTDTLRFRIESENGRKDSTTAVVAGTNTPPRGLSQVNTPATGGVMTSGEFVAGTPISVSRTITGSNLSSKVMAGVGDSELMTSSTPSE